MTATAETRAKLSVIRKQWWAAKKAAESFLRPATIVGPLPNNIANGQLEDAVPVMANLNWIINQVNANAQATGLAALLAAANTFTQVQSGIAATNAANFPIASQVQNQSFNTLSSTLGTNTLTARVAALALSAYGSGQVFRFIPSQTNTGAATLSIDGLAATPILAYSLPLGAGYLRQNVPVEVEHDGVNFNIMGTPQGQAQGGLLTTLTSTAGSQAITTRVATLPLAAYVTGQVFTFTPASSNNPGGVTVNIDSLGAKNLAVAGVTAPIGKELVANVPTALQFDGTNLNLLARQPGRVLVGSSSAAVSATIDFNNIFSSQFSEFEIELTDVKPGTNGDDLWMRVSIDGGATFKAGVADYAWNIFERLDAAADSGGGTTSDSKINLCRAVASAQACGVTIKIGNPSGTALRKWVDYKSRSTGSASTIANTIGSGTYAGTTSAVNGIRFMFSTGTITSGTFKVFGIRTT